MATAIFIGLLCIAEALGMVIEPDSKEVVYLGTLFAGIIVYDIVHIFK